jgi:lysophospholipase L1-like esterase
VSAPAPRRWSRYVALGDSTSEALEDPYPDGAGYRGWTDRPAERLATLEPRMLYANLAVRGKLARQVRAEQLDAAPALAPDRATALAGLNSEGHARIAAAAASALELPDADLAWSAPLPPAARASRVAAPAADARWAREHFAPWVLRRLRGVSSGDGRVAKRPELLPVLPPSHLN